MLLALLLPPATVTDQGWCMPRVGPHRPPREKLLLAEARTLLCALSYCPTSDQKITSDVPLESLLIELIEGNVKPWVVGLDADMPFWTTQRRYFIPSL